MSAAVGSLHRFARAIFVRILVVSTALHVTNQKTTRYSPLTAAWLNVFIQLIASISSVSKVFCCTGIVGLVLGIQRVFSVWHIS